MIHYTSDRSVFSESKLAPPISAYHLIISRRLFPGQTIHARFQRVEQKHGAACSVMLPYHADARAALQAAAAAASCYLSPSPFPRRCAAEGRRRWRWPRPPSVPCRRISSRPGPLSASLDAAPGLRGDGKPAICTADELHFVPVPGTEWRLALWRYTPSPEAPARNHPLLLLSGVGTNAIGYDLSPRASFARHMSMHGFDTWIVEVRGAGLSTRGSALDGHELESEAISQPDISTQYNLNSIGNDNTNGGFSIEPKTVMEAVPEAKISSIHGNKMEPVTWDESQLVIKLTTTFMLLAERLSGYLNEGQLRDISAKFLDRISKLLEDTRLSDRFDETRGNIIDLLEARRNSAVGGQIRDLSQRLVNIFEEGQRSVSPQLFDLQERLSTTIEDFQKQLDLIVAYDWDFDNYLEEDIPAAMEYIKLQSKTKDGKLLAIGHSMGGILLYAMLSKCGFEGKNSGLAAVVTLAASVDYTSSNSSLKMLLPLADPAQALNVPVVPLGALLAAAFPLSRPPYALPWLISQITAQDMMHPELLEKLVYNNFCTIPAKVLLQLTTAFRVGGLRNRAGTFCYKDHLNTCTIPVLALAGDQDLICPPSAVYETSKLIPEHLVTYKLVGKPDGSHYAHYDLVGGRMAVEEVYPCIIDFLCQHDDTATTCE